MYNVSQAFLDAVKQPAQEHRIQGVISGGLGNTSFDESNIKSGTFHITNQSTDTNDVVLGSVYVGTLTATFYGLDSHIDRYSWIGRRITPSFGLRIGTNEWENVPLGIFTVKEAVHTAEGIEVTAYDDMIKFDKKFKPENFQFQGGMWAFIDQVCEDCGVDNGMTDEYIESLPNGDKDLMIAGAYGALKDFANDIETYRDLVFWMAQTMACFATINRDGALEFRQYKSVDNYVDTITETHRLAGATFDDYVTNYTGVWYKNIKEGTDSYYGYDPEELEAALQRSQDHLVDLEGQLTQLEADYAAGRITETEYKAQKKELNRRIKNVKKRIKWEMDALEHIEDGAFMEMGANPFLQTGTGESVITMRNNVLNALDAISYTPFSCSTVVGVHYDLGDIIQFTGGHATEAGEACCLMMYDYNLNGAYVMEGFGVDPAIPMVHNTNEKSTNAANKNGLSASKSTIGSTLPDSGKSGDIHFTTAGTISAEPLNTQHMTTSSTESHPISVDNFSGNYTDGYSFVISGFPNSRGDGENVYFDLQGLTAGCQYTIEFDANFTRADGGWPWSSYYDHVSCNDMAIQLTPALGSNHYSGTFTYLENGRLAFEFPRVSDDANFSCSFSNMKIKSVDNSIDGVSVHNGDQWVNVDYVKDIDAELSSGTKIATAHNSDGTETDIYAPANKVDDVKVDGTSVVDANKVANINTMTGASASAAGVKGLVPAPAQGDENKFLRGDGTWAQGGGGTTVVANPTGAATANLSKLQVDETIYQIVGGGGSGGGFEQIVLWDYVTDNNNSVLFGTFNVTLHDDINNYDMLLVESVSYSGDMSSATWSSTSQFIVSVDALNNAYNNNYLAYTSFDNRSSRYYIKDTTFQKTIDNIGSTNGLVKVYGLKFSGGGGTGGASAVSDLTDVELNNLSNGQILQYNSTTQKWENADNQGSGQVSALSYQQLTPTEYENLTTAEKNNGTIYFVSENSTGVSGLKVITISQADYDNLTTAQKNNGVPYFVY